MYDGTKILVKELKIEMKENLNDEFICFGVGEITGSPLFCSKHHCSKNGKKFCLYPKNEITYFITEQGKFPIRAWGEVTKRVYDFKSEKEKECVECNLECNNEGIKVSSNIKITGIEICLKKCIYISFSEVNQPVILPKQDLISGFEVKVKFFKNGEILKEKV